MITGRRSRDDWRRFALDDPTWLHIYAYIVDLYIGSAHQYHQQESDGNTLLLVASVFAHAFADAANAPNNTGTTVTSRTVTSRFFFYTNVALYNRSKSDFTVDVLY